MAHKTTARAGDIRYQPNGTKWQAFVDDTGKTRWRAYLDAWEMKKLRDLWPVTPTAEMADLFGLSPCTIDTIARREGLKKNKAWLRSRCRAAAVIANAKMRKRGFPNMAKARAAAAASGNRFDFATLPKERREEIKKKAIEGHRRAVAEELSRISAGLPPKTKYKMLTRQEKAIVGGRRSWVYVMRKRGFSWDLESKTLTAGEGVNIRPSFYQTAQKYGITIKSALL